MYRLLYIFDFEDVFIELDSYLDQIKHSPHIASVIAQSLDTNADRDKLLRGLVRGFLRERLYLNVLPDLTLGYFDIARDVLNLDCSRPDLASRIYYQVGRGLLVDRGTEWAYVNFTNEHELQILFDFRPVDFSGVTGPVRYPSRWRYRRRLLQT